MTTNNMYRVVYIIGQGYGWFTPEAYANVPTGFQRHVITLAYCTEKEYAQLLFDALPQHYTDADVRRSHKGAQDTEATILHTCRKQEMALADLLHQMSEAGRRYIERQQPQPTQQIQATNKETQP